MSLSVSTPLPHTRFRVSHPFDVDTQADMILRSSDGVDFRVMKGILAVSSPIFQDMTTLAKPSAYDCTDPSSAEGLPVVVMYESDAIVLDVLLRLLYPVVPPKLDDLSLVSGLLCAAQKYEMEAVLYYVKAELRKMAALDDGCLAMEIFSLACEYRLEDEARLAAWEFLKYPLRSTYFAGLERVSGSALFHLFDYRRRVADKIDTIFAPLESYMLPEALASISRYFECPTTRKSGAANGCGSNECGHIFSSWWCTLRETARSEVQKAPISEAVFNFSLVSRAASTSRCCSDCQTSAFRSLPTIVSVVKSEIKKAASEIKLTLPWT
ncbi:hypothetical protein M0805_008105 [Coniferiporia weirii]|nr:hypothetical protein M0805_008105 [Coniferiporia weirii]